MKWRDCARCLTILQEEVAFDLVEIGVLRLIANETVDVGQRAFEISGTALLQSCDGAGVARGKALIAGRVRIKYRLRDIEVT